MNAIELNYIFIKRMIVMNFNLNHYPIKYFYFIKKDRFLEDIVGFIFNTMKFHMLYHYNDLLFNYIVT
jgi:hypothetical protein